MKKVLLGITLLAFVATATFAHDKGKEKEKCEKSGSCCKKGETASASCKEMEKQAKVDAKDTKKEVKKVAVAKKA